MSPDLQELEASLSGLRPAALERALLARLEDSAKGTLTTLGTAETQFETSLRQILPARLPASLMAALDATLTTRTAAADATIVPFPQPADHRRQGRRPMLAAAAAVALLGAAAALFMPGKGAPHTAATPASHPPQSAPLTVPAAAPAAQNVVFNTGLSQASDEGVLWQSKNQPTRVVKVVYWDRVTVVSPEGRKIEYEKPRVEYILVPEKID